MGIDQLLEEIYDEQLSRRLMDEVDLAIDEALDLAKEEDLQEHGKDSFFWREDVEFVRKPTK